MKFNFLPYVNTYANVGKNIESPKQFTQNLILPCHKLSKSETCRTGFPAHPTRSIIQKHYEFYF